MALKLYRRHRKECEAGRAEDDRTGQFEESRRGWKRCSCLIHAAGTINRKFNRRQTGESDWDRARAVADAWVKTGSWDADFVAPQPVVPAKVSVSRITIAEAVKAFLAELQESASFAYHKKYRLLLKRLETFSTERGYAMIDQWEPMDVRQFRSTWPLSPATAVRRMAMLRPFFEYCVSNKWIASNPAASVKNPKTRKTTEQPQQKLPFSDDEIKKMYAACEKYGGTWRHKWNGEDVSDFISLSIYTGLRISDVALFHVDRLQTSGEIRVRTTKAGTHVYTWVPQWLQDRIHARAKKYGPLIFGEHTTKNLDVITELWRRKLNLVWDECGKWKDKPHPHRFRHTFARILLQKPGVTVRDVAELLGNTEDVVRKHYGAWVPERQARLTKILKEAFDDKPKPKVVSIA